MNLWMMEDQGWIGVKNKDLTKKVVASLRIHGGETRFRRAKKREDTPREALQKAKDRVGRPDMANLDLSIPGDFDVTSTKLGVMTQALLYQGILEQKKKSDR